MTLFMLAFFLKNFRFAEALKRFSHTEIGKQFHQDGAFDNYDMSVFNFEITKSLNLIHLWQEKFDTVYGFPSLILW